MDYYYLDESKTPQGPIPSQRIIELVADGTLGLETHIAAEGEDTWKRLREILPTLNSPAVPATYNNKNTQSANETDTQPLNWIPALVLYAVASGGVILAGLVELGNPDAANFLYLLMVPVMILSTVFFWILHYKCWKAIPEEYRETSPGKAVGFMFIPLFNFAWGFVTWPKLITGIQQWQRSKHIPESNLSALSMTFAILFILMWTLGWVPGLSIIISIADLTVFIILYRRLKSAIDQLVS